MFRVGKLTLKDITVLNLFKTIVSISFIISLLTTKTLWDRVGRSLPACPLFGFTEIENSYFYPVLLLFLLASLFFTAFWRISRYFTGLSILLWISFVFLDLNCFQPSFYFFSTILLLFWLKEFRYLNETQVFFLIRAIVSASYFFGGLHKINPVYYDTIYLWMIQGISTWVGNGEIHNVILKLGFFTPYIEMLVGILLLIPSTNKIASIGAIMMHCFILLCLGPWGLKFNYIILPWNISLILFNIMFFYESTNSNFSFNYFKNPAILTLLGINWVLPLGYFFKICDSYPSHDLYSGKPYFGFIVMDSNTALALPDEIKSNFEPYNDKKKFLNLTKWSLNEVGVPIYPEKRVLHYYKHWFEKFERDPKSVELIIYSQKSYETFH